MKKIIALLFLLCFSPFVIAADIALSGGIGGSDIYGKLSSPTSSSSSDAQAQAQQAQAQVQQAAQAAAQARAAAQAGAQSQADVSPGAGGGNFAADSGGGGTTSTNPFADTVFLTPKPSDISMGYLSAIFGTVDGVLPGRGSQILGKMFGTFNSVVLSLGGILLMYVVIVSTLNTAHEGEVMGKKWSSIWIPMRTALGVGFLIPKASGYSLIQIMMMWIVSQGIGAANSVWNVTLDYLKSGGVIVNVQQGSNNPDIEATKTTVKNAVKAVTCVYALQNILTAYQQANPSAPQAGNLFATIAADDVNGWVDLPGRIPNYPAYKGTCGRIKWAVSPDDPQKNTAYSTGAMQIVADLSGIAQQLATANPSGPPPIFSDFSAFYNAVQDYGSVMLPAMNKANVSGSLTGAIDTMKNNGWIMAGAFYGIITQNTSQALQSITPPSVEKMGITEVLSVLQGIDKTVFSGANATQMMAAASAADAYSLQAADQASVYLPPATGAPPSIPPAKGLAMKILGLQPIQDTLGWVVNLNSLAGPIDDALNKVLIDPMNKLIASLTIGSGNPIQTISGYGSLLLGGALGLWNSAATFSIALSVFSAIVPLWGPAIVQVVSTATMWIMPFLGSLVFMGFTAGILACFYIPLIPFIFFSFGAIGWLVGVIETMVAAPLVAIGLMSPEGDEAFGRASPAIMLITSVFLRPTLMLFGYISGIIMSYIGLWLVTKGFIYASLNLLQTALTGGVATGAGASFLVASTVASLTWSPIMAVINIGVGLAMLVVIAVVSLAVLYSIMATIVVQKAFELIHVVPDAVLRWIGGTDKGPGAHVGQEMAGEADKKAHAGAEQGGKLLQTHDAKLRQGAAKKEGTGTIQSSPPPNT